MLPEDDCPPADACGAERAAYRFVYSASTGNGYRPVDAGSFTVQANKIPKRFQSKPCCTDCAVSLFETERDARDFFAAAPAEWGDLRKKAGDHLARVDLTPAHGVQTEADAEAHFDLHEYDGVNLCAVTTVLGPL